MDAYDSSVVVGGTVKSSDVLHKVPTGIKGFDEITVGGLPKGRATLVCGSAGTGKTVFAMEFLVRGAVEYGEPGVLIAFEETSTELAQSFASLGFDLQTLVARRLLALDFVHVERSEIIETGDYDLNGLFVRIAYAIDSVGAKRVVIDSLETLFSALGDEAILRSEFRRLFRWLKERGVTAIITGERGDGTLTRHGIEEYVSDCVILLDQRVHERVATRYLRVVKYRGTVHGTNEYPFLIHEGGISVVPVTSLGLTHQASEERMSTGVPRLDAMLGGKGIYRGSSVLVSGTAGTGKSSLAAHAVHAACKRGERCLYFAFEESQGQYVRNMRSIGVDLQPWIDKGLLQFHASRPTYFGLEMHLASMQRTIENFDPSLVVVDPVTNFAMVATPFEVRSMLMRLVDSLKSRGITGIFTSLTAGGSALDETDVGMSSLMDTWLLVQFLEASGERNRGLYVLKSRGMAHSHQVREFSVSSHGLDLIDVYVGPSGVLTGSARQAQEAKERTEALVRQQHTERKQRELARKRAQLDAQILALRAAFEAEEQDVLATLEQDKRREVSLGHDREQQARLRQADPSKQNGGAG